MKIASIVGARPQFIKLGPLSKKIRNSYDEIIIHSGQHFDKEMSELIFNDLSIPLPDYNLNINQGLHGEQTGKMLQEIEKVILIEKPDLILIFGDTNTTLAGALVGAKLHIKTLHIEAGLRSFNRQMPEEINRIVADHTSDLLFAPTMTALKNLENEGLKDVSYLTGDIMTDSLRGALPIADSKSKILEELQISPGQYYVLTLHRPYNVDDPDLLKSLLNKLQQLGKKLVFPIHPRTRIILELSKYKAGKNLILINPLGYLDFLKLQHNAYMILTDSGGIQKEAYILEKPCITLRTETEWLETVESGWNLLADTQDPQLLDKINSFTPQSRRNPLFGENVAQKMLSIIDEILSR